MVIGGELGVISYDGHVNDNQVQRVKRKIEWFEAEVKRQGKAKVVVENLEFRKDTVTALFSVMPRGRSKIFPEKEVYSWELLFKISDPGGRKDEEAVESSKN